MRPGPQGDLLLQFGRDLIRGQVRHDHDEVEDIIDHTTGDGCRLAVEVLTRQAKKGMIIEYVFQSRSLFFSFLRRTQRRRSGSLVGDAKDDLSVR